MRICLVTSVYALSDNDLNAAFLVESTRQLVARGHQVQVFAPSYHACPSHSVEGVPVHRFRYFLARWENLTHGRGAPTRLRNPLYLFIAVFYITYGMVALLRLCRKQQFDVLHVHWPFPHGIWGCAVSRLFTIPMVLTFHSAELMLVHRFRFVAFFLRRAIACASGIICNSSFTARELAEYGHADVKVIPFGATIVASGSTSTSRVEGNAVRNILFVGRLIERKGLCYLLEALPAVLAKQPLRLHVVGDGPLAPACQNQAAALGIAEAVVFHGIVSDDALRALYATADVFVLPSIVDRSGDTEGLGVVLVEAMGFGCPVVASAVGGIPDVVLDGTTGLLVEAATPAALTTAILMILQDEPLGQRLGTAGQQRVSEYFNWDRITHAVEQVYKSAVSVKEQV